MLPRTPTTAHNPQRTTDNNDDIIDYAPMIEELKDFMHRAMQVQLQQTEALVKEQKETAQQLRRELQDLNERTADAFADIQNQLILERPVSTPDKQQEKVEARRATTYIGARESGISHGVLGDHIQQVVQPQVLVAQQKPDPNSLMRRISLKDLGNMLGSRREFTFTNNQHTLPAQHCSETVKKKMVDWNRSNGFPLSNLLNYSSIHNLEEPDFLRLAGSYIRGTQAWSWAGYVATLGNCVTPLKSNDPSQTTIEIEGYHLNMHTPVNTLLDKIEERRKILRTGATEEEMKTWPKPGYGKSNKADEAGEIRVVHKLLGPFADGFEAFITLEVLKSLKDVEEWFKVMRKANDDLQKMSQTYVLNKSRLIKPKGIDWVVDNTPNQPTGVTRRSLHIESPVASQPESDSRRFQGSKGLEQSLVHKSPVKHDDGNTPHHEYTNSQHVVSEPLNCLSSNDDYSQYDDEFYTYLYNEDDASFEHDDSLKPCYQFFFDDNCDGQCGRSHSADDMYGLRNYQLQKLLDSKWVKPQWVISEINKMLQNKQEEVKRIAAVKRLKGPLYPVQQSPQSGR